MNRLRKSLFDWKERRKPHTNKFFHMQMVTGIRKCTKKKTKTSEVSEHETWDEEMVVSLRRQRGEFTDIGAIDFRLGKLALRKESAESRRPNTIAKLHGVRYPNQS